MLAKQAKCLVRNLYPRWCDARNIHNINPCPLKQAITSLKTKAITTVHDIGQCADYDMQTLRKQKKHNTLTSPLEGWSCKVLELHYKGK